MTLIGGASAHISHYTVGTHENRREYLRLMDERGAEYTRRGKTPRWTELGVQKHAAFTAAKVDYRARIARLKEEGFKTPYFQFRNDDPIAKEVAKEEADAFAAEWAARVGFPLDVREGCFL